MSSWFSIHAAYSAQVDRRGCGKLSQPPCGRDAQHFMCEATGRAERSHYHSGVRRSPTTVLLFAALAGMPQMFLVGCGGGSDSGNSGNGQGGSSANSSGGSIGTGGASSSGGVTAAGGASSSGGVTAAGGASSSGGATAAGGASSLGGATVAAGSSSGGAMITVPENCNVVLPTECPSPSPVYTDVQPIFAERCVACHSGAPGGPWPLTTYGHVATWRDTIRAALATCEMPPVDSGLTLSPEESSLILTWIRCGMPL